MKIYIIIILIFLSYECYSKLVISEILASNFRGLLDEDNDDSDWIELYNDSDKELNLAGYRISDNDNYDKAFILPDTILKAKERIVIFASGKNRYNSDKYWVETTGMGVAPHLTDEIFHFMYLPVSGNFEAELEICEIINGKDFSGCGLIYKSELDSKSPYATILSNVGRKSYTSLIKLNSEEYPFFNQSNFLYKDFSRIKIELKDSIISTYCIGYDNYSWVLIQQMEINWKSGFLGIALAATDYQNIRKELFSFKNFKLNGSEINPYLITSKDISDKDLGTRYFKRNEIHTDFKLGIKNEELYLWDSKGSKIDYVTIDKQITNFSYSFINNKYQYSNPTPGQANSTGIEEIVLPPSLIERSIIGKRETEFHLEYENENRVFYTIDGSEPSLSSNVLKSSIFIDSSAVVRAKTFKNGHFSLEETMFFSFSEEKTSLPVVSIVVNEDYLYDNNKGIMINENLSEDIEVPALFKYLDDNKGLEYYTKCGLKIHGKASRYELQKSFRLYARDLYFNDDFDLNFWDYSNNMKSEVIVLKNGGQDGKYTYLRDQFGEVLASKYFQSTFAFNVRPIITYLNGEFYGIQILKERFDEKLVSRKFNVSKESVNIYSNETELKNGRVHKFIDFKNKFLVADTIENDFESEFNKYFDIENLFDYTILRGFSNDQDWPVSNQTIWNSEEIDLKWRWVSNDFDLAFSFPGVNSTPDKNIYNQIFESNSSYGNLLKKIFKIEELRNIYANKLADNLNSYLNEKTTIPILDSLASLIREDSPRQQKIFENYLVNFENEINRLKKFLRNRPDFFFQHTAEEFGQSGLSSITFTQNYENAGVFHINSLNITDEVWTGKYFNEIPINVKVSSNPGFRFIGWINVESNDSVLTNILPKDFEKFEAVFEKTNEVAEPFKKMLVINEIMYKPYEFMDCGDWIELYNNGNRDIDLTNWSFRDENFQHVYNILDGVILKSGEFLIIAQDPMKFRSYYGVAKNIIGGFEFGLGGDDEIRIYNENNQIVDEVRYKNNLPWDEFANGTGYSLELIHPDLDNSLPEHWRASLNYSGSPIAHNTVLNIEMNKNEIDVNVYPNPFNEFIIIQNNRSEIYLEIYNILGEKLLRLDNINSNQKLDLSTYNSGVYYFVFKNFKGDLIRTLNIIKN